MTIYDLAQRIKRLTGCPGEIVFQPLHYTDVELRIPNVDKARELLGFEAKVELDEGSSERSPGTGRTPRDDRPDPARAAGRRGGGARSRRGGVAQRAAHDGPEGGGVRGALARACGVEHAAAVSSGTAALHLAMLALGSGRGTR